MKYVIDSETYEKHIRDEVHLYGLLHQLAFLAGKVKDAEDMANLVKTAKHYGEIAEEKFDDWLIPGRYLVFGDRTDLAGLKEVELTPLTAVLKEHDAKIRKSSVPPLTIPPTSFPAAPSVCWWAISLSCWRSMASSTIAFWM